MYYYWLINCNKCTLLTPDVNNRGKGGVGGEGEGEGIPIQYPVSLKLV